MGNLRSASILVVITAGCALRFAVPATASPTEERTDDFPAFVRESDGRLEAGSSEFGVSFSADGALAAWETGTFPILRENGPGAVWKLAGEKGPESLTYFSNPPLSWKWKSARTMASWTVGPDEIGVILANNALSPAVFSIPLHGKYLMHVRTATGHWEKVGSVGGAVTVDRLRWRFPDGRIGLWRGEGRVEFEPATDSWTLAVPVDSGGVTDWSWHIGDVALVSPQRYAVYQRSTQAKGRMLIEGMAPSGSIAITVAVTGGESPFIANPSRTFELVADPSTGAFSDIVEMAAGGWYRMKMTARDADGKVTATRTLEPFGIGEVFVIAGQSNSTNSGQTPTRSNSSLVTTFSGSGWRPAVDPMPGTHDNAPRGSFQPSMGDALAARLEVPVGIASTGQGASAIRHWQPDYEPDFESKTYCNGLYPWTLYRIRQLGVGGFRALLWHQGEGDASGGLGKDKSKVERYSQALIRVLSSWRQDSGWDFPAFTAQASLWPMSNAKYGGDRYLRAAQALVWEMGFAYPGPDTDQLGLEYRQDDSERRVHFNAAGLQAHGEMWAEKLVPFIESELDKP